MHYMCEFQKGEGEGPSPSKKAKVDDKAKGEFNQFVCVLSKPKVVYVCAHLCMCVLFKKHVHVLYTYMYRRSGNFRC